MTAVRRAREAVGTDGGSARMAMIALDQMLWWSTAIQTDHVMAVSSKTNEKHCSAKSSVQYCVVHCVLVDVLVVDLFTCMFVEMQVKQYYMCGGFDLFAHTH